MAAKPPSFEDGLRTALEPYRGAVVDVCDTAELCRRWLCEAGLQPTAADVVALVTLVMREAARREITGRVFPGDDA